MTSSSCIPLVGLDGLIVENLEIRMRNLRKRDNPTSGYWVSEKDSMHGIRSDTDQSESDCFASFCDCRHHGVKNTSQIKRSQRKNHVTPCGHGFYG